MRHHAQTIEPNQSWAGPYCHVMSIARGLHIGPYPENESMMLRVSAEAQPTPYPPDVLAAIPWAKDAGLELKNAKDGTWLYMTGTHYASHPQGFWYEHVYRPGSRHLYVGGFPTRDAALKSPPPKPPGFVEPTTDQYPADVLAACPKAREWGVVLFVNGIGHADWRANGGRHRSNGDRGWAMVEVDRVCNYLSRTSALADPPTEAPPGYAEPKAERSAVDRLGEVLFWLLGGANCGVRWDRQPEYVKRMYREAAQAVRLAELEEPWADSDVLEAANAAILQFSCGKSKLHMQSKVVEKQWLDVANAALSAALASRVERAKKEGGGG